jgi:hypothetical protein
MFFLISLRFTRFILFIDLLNQKFDAKKDDFKHQASVKSQSNGITVTSSAISETSGLDKLTGKVNVKYEDKTFGDVSVEYVTAGKVKATTKLNKLQKGLVVNGETEIEKAISGKVGAEYTQENFAGSLEFNHKKNAILASAVVGYDGFAVGAALSSDIAKIQSGDSSAHSIDFGAQYEDGSIIGTATVESNNNIGVSIFHRLNSDLQLASKFIATTNKGNSLALGAQYRVNPATVVKGKTLVFSDQSFVLSGFVQHKLANPNVTVGISNQWSSATQSNTGFGVNVAFGDN